MQGVTELFWESAEPSFDEQPLDDFLTRFPGGMYTFVGTTVDGQSLNGKATLTHAIPDGPKIVSPAEGAVLNPKKPVVIDWDAVTDPFPGTGSAVKIAGYQVIVAREKPTLRVLSVDVGPTITT